LCSHSLPPILNSLIPDQPNFYFNKRNKRGETVAGNDYIRCCFINDWNWHAQYMSCPNPNNPSDRGCAWGKFAGPVWGHVNMYPNTLDWFLR